MDHLTLLFSFTDQIEELNEVQYWIDNARSFAPSNQVVQLAMDRHQTDIDRKRTAIGYAMANIRNRN